ncbi:methyl-accepting chemotaxis protein [Methylobacterium sp. C33D]
MRPAALTSAKTDLRTLLLSAAAGGAIGGVPLVLGLAPPAQLLYAAAAALCGALVARGLQPPWPPARPVAPPAAALPEAVTSGVPVPAAPGANRAEAVARDLGDLDPFFAVTREQLRSIAAQTEAAAAAILASLRTLDAAQGRSAACIGGAHDRIVGFAEQSDAALQSLAAALGAYLDRRLSETREERSTVEAAVEQMRGLDALILSLEKVGAATRMLALNANIEAARAGAQGSGFRVIARELQDLAQSAQTAMAEARLQVAGVQQTISRVLIADRGDDATRTEQERLRALMAELGGIAETTTRVLLGMARTDLAEVKAQNAAVGHEVLSVFGQVQFQDVVRQQIEAVDAANATLQLCLDGLRRRLSGTEPERAITPAEILGTARARYVTQIQRRVDAQALGQDPGSSPGSSPGQAVAGPAAPDIELF